ncbi:hypothetical protein BGX31_009919 [Mortierella sp. GBA43]|nr:hypothetical protein BGX31_009919 [Mortierella sp. GBA43]
MLSRSLVPAPKNALSLKQALELSNLYLENAYKTVDQDIVLVLCHEAEMALIQAKSANKRDPLRSNNSEYQGLCDGVATAYIDLGKLLERQGYRDVSQAICKKAEKWGGTIHDPGRLAQSLHNMDTMQHPKGMSITGDTRTIDAVDTRSLGHYGRTISIASTIFPMNLRPPTIEFKLPESDERLTSTPQLACCLSLIQATFTPDDILDSPTKTWLKIVEKDTDEQERLKSMAVEVLRVFKRDELKDAKAVAEVVYLGPILNKDPFQDLLREFYSGINNSGLLNVHHLEGIAQLIQSAGPGYLDADDLVKILGLLSTRLKDTHHQSAHHMHLLTLTVSHVLDAMADTRVKDLDREKLHEPLSSYLRNLQGSTDPYLVYQAAYAFQALLCVPDNETVWQAAMRRTGKVVQGISGLVSAVKSLDLNKFLEGLEDIQRGIGEASDIVDLVKTACEGVTSLGESGKSFLDCLKEGLSFERKRDWYSALRGLDALIREGELATFKRLVCEAPCRLDAAFQWGVCQRLGTIATNPMWDVGTRKGAVDFLAEIYQNDEAWGQHASVKQWIINILMRLVSSGDEQQCK